MDDELLDDFFSDFIDVLVRLRNRRTRDIKARQNEIPADFSQDVIVKKRIKRVKEYPKSLCYKVNLIYGCECTDSATPDYCCPYCAINSCTIRRVFK